MGTPGAIAPAAWLPLIEPISPGAKQVTRPLEATRNCAGQFPAVTGAVGLEPCDCAVYNFPSALPATPTFMPGMVYSTENACLPWLACMAQSPAVLNWSAVACTSRRPQSVAPDPAASFNFCWTGSGEFAAADIGVELDDATGADDLLQATERERVRRTIEQVDFITVIVNRGSPNVTGTPGLLRPRGRDDLADSRPEAGATVASVA